MASAGQGQPSKCRPELLRFKKEALLHLYLKNKASIGSSRRMLFTSSASKCFPKEKVDFATSGKGRYLLIMDIPRGMLGALAALFLVSQAIVLAGGHRTRHTEQGERGIARVAHCYGQ